MPAEKAWLPWKQEESNPKEASPQERGGHLRTGEGERERGGEGERKVEYSKRVRLKEAERVTERERIVSQMREHDTEK